MSQQEVKCIAFECGKIIDDNVPSKIDHFQTFHPQWWSLVMSSSKNKDPYERSDPKYHVKNSFERLKTK